MSVVFRLNLEVGDLSAAVGFYAELLRVAGRELPGSRCYFTCGQVTLGVVDVSADHAARPLPTPLYLAVADLDEVHARAERLGCLAGAEVHGEASGEIVVRPWGERSFYVADPWGNPLCFVDAATRYDG